MLRVCVCILTFVIRHGHRVFCAPYYIYCYLWTVWLCQIFPQYLIKVTIFGKIKLVNIKYVS
jgi:hypothetical protein